MQKIYLISLFFILPALVFPLNLSSRDEGYKIVETLQWQAPKEILPGHSILCFDGAVNHDSLGYLPVFEYVLPASFTGTIKTISLANEIYEPAGPMDALDFPDLGLIGEEPKILVSSFQAGKSRRQSVCLMPLRKASGEDGYERLVSFELDITIDEERTPLSSVNDRIFAS